MPRLVLHIDDLRRDDAPLRKALEGVPGHSFEVCRVADFAEAIEQLTTRSFDIVFVDHDLRVPADVIEFVRDARDFGYQRALFVLTGPIEGRTAARLIQAGADDFLEKMHVSPGGLARAIETAQIHTIHRKMESELEARTMQLARMLERESLALRELEIAKRQVEEASRSKSTFLANMSHEIRTPLTAILGFAEELLVEPLDDAERRDAVRIILQNGEFLLQILSDILDFSKIEAGKLEVEIVPVSPSKIVADVVRLMEAPARANATRLRSESTGPIPVTILSDPVRLRQIVTNLVSNAIKFTSDGEVVVGLRRSEEPGADLVLEVRDTGIGMSEEEAARIFAAFEQADSSTTRRYGGSGLGLSICQRLARLLGGSIEVESRLDEGSTFRVTIPAGSNVESPAAASSESSSEIAVPEAALPPCRILLADDNQMNRRLVTGILERSGARVLAATNGREVLDTVEAAEEPIDLILMDLQMPVLDGIDATKQLRARGFRAPIVALTGNALESDRQLCLESGFDDFASKPLRRAALLELTHRHLAAASIESAPGNSPTK